MSYDTIPCDTMSCNKISGTKHLRRKCLRTKWKGGTKLLSNTSAKRLWMTRPFFQLKTPIKVFSFDSRPICLPTIKMWEENFVDRFVRIFGYGRTEKVPDPTKDQTSCKLLTGNIKIVDPKSDVCLKVAKVSLIGPRNQYYKDTSELPNKIALV